MADAFIEMRWAGHWNGAARPLAGFQRDGRRSSGTRDASQHTV